MTNETAPEVTVSRVALGLFGVGLVAVAGYHHLTYGSSVGLAGLVAVTGVGLAVGAGSLPRLGIDPGQHSRVLGAAAAGGIVVAALGVLAQTIAARPPTVENGGAGVAFLAGGGGLVGYLIGANVVRLRQLRRDLSETEATADRLAEERDRFEVLNRTTRSLLRAEEPEAVAELLVDEGRVGLPGPFAGVWLYEPHRDRLVPAATTATDPDWEAEQLWPDGGAMALFRNGEAGRIEDEGLPDLNELYGVPLGEAGVLAVGTPGRFDDRDRNITKVYARSAAVTLERIERERDLERNDERLETFASVLANDLRTPVNVIESRVGLAEETGETDDLDEVLGAVERIEAVVDDVLELARDGERVVETEPVRLADVVDDAWADVETYRATLDVEDLPTVEGDRDRLRRLFAKLFRNAVDHGGHHVAVTVGRLEDRRGFFVADDGPGIPPAVRRRVFEEGYSLEDGPGLGLAIVRGIAEAHGWSVTVAEGAAGGASLEFDLGGVDGVGTAESDQPKPVDDRNDGAAGAAADDREEASDEDVEFALESDREQPDSFDT